MNINIIKDGKKVWDENIVPKKEHYNSKDNPATASLVLGILLILLSIGLFSVVGMYALVVLILGLYCLAASDITYKNSTEGMTNKTKDSNNGQMSSWPFKMKTLDEVRITQQEQTWKGYCGSNQPFIMRYSKGRLDLWISIYPKDLSKFQEGIESLHSEFTVVKEEDKDDSDIYRRIDTPMLKGIINPYLDGGDVLK